MTQLNKQTNLQVSKNTFFDVEVSFDKGIVSRRFGNFNIQKLKIFKFFKIFFFFFFLKLISELENNREN